MDGIETWLTLEDMQRIWSVVMQNAPEVLASSGGTCGADQVWCATSTGGTAMIYSWLIIIALSFTAYWYVGVIAALWLIALGY